tara:strand:- start:105 stop:272 length:168 start_codon:yes stop_codon:yes gene_type:complete
MQDIAEFTNDVSKEEEEHILTNRKKVSKKEKKKKYTKSKELGFFEPIIRKKEANK